MRHLLACAVFLSLTSIASAADATSPGELKILPPTLINLAFEWPIQGDDNLNAAVTVRYRAAGEENWKQALPLRRVPAGKSVDAVALFLWDNKLSGSIFDLRPDTQYEVTMQLKDPDGGEAQQTVMVRTRPVPDAPANAPVRNVDPATVNDVQPGEIGLLADGDYGNFIAPRNGQPGKPVVYRAAGPGAKFSSVSMKNRKHVYLEGVTIRQTERWVRAVDLTGAADCVVRRCDIECVNGIVAVKPKAIVAVAQLGFGKAAGPAFGYIGPGARNCYIADNTIKGTTPWTNEAMGAGGKNVGEGIEITGPGNVICFNRVSNFRDCISTWEDDYCYAQYCLDIYNNDIEVGADDGIEADFTMGNSRIMRNRLTNCFVGLSSQPSLGGPSYFIRNVMYNLTYVPFKFHRASRGDVVLHNTVVKPGDGMVTFAGSKEMDFAFYRNNICIGGPNGEKNWGRYGAGMGLAANIVKHGPHCDYDYDALGTWNKPFQGKIGTHAFNNLDEMRNGPHEKNGLVVELDIFPNVAFPEQPESLYPPPDLRPRPDANVVDAGQLLPNINDHFTGNAPDIGAYEVGQPMPHYGPRPAGMDESTHQP